MDETRVWVVIPDDSDRNRWCRLIQSAGLTAEAHESGETFLAGQRPDQPGVLLTDVRLPDQSGLALLGAMTDQTPSRPVIFYSGFFDVQAAVHAMKGGAFDLFEAGCSPTLLLDAIQRAVAMDSRRRRANGCRTMIQQRLAGLNARERRALLMVANGESTREVAEALETTPKAIEGLRSRIMAKLDVNSTVEMVQLQIAANVCSRACGNRPCTCGLTCPLGDSLQAA